jgi:exodeoxyribonuclease VII large subunit
VPVRAELIERVGTLGARLGGSLGRGLERRRVDLRAASARLPRPDMLLGMAQQRFDRAGERLGRGLMANERAAEGKFARVAARLRPDALTQDISRRRQRAGELTERLSLVLRRRVADKMKALAASGRILETLSYQSVLSRGFALVTGADGHLVRSASALSEGDGVRLRFADGEAPAVIGQGGTAASPKPAPQIEPPAPDIKKKAKSDKPDPGGQGSLF